LADFKGWDPIQDPDPFINKQNQLRKTLISTVLLLLNHFSYLKTEIIVPSVPVSYKQKTLEKKFTLMDILKVTELIRVRIKNVDTKHWLFVI
jgi:hypothetical protein